MQSKKKDLLQLYLLLITAVLMNIGLWLYTNKIYIKWPNVPAAPSITSMRSAFLSDDAFAFRTWSIALQNFGSMGESQPLKDYNYKYLNGWFFLLDKLDYHSNFVPFLAAYYFSATQDPQQLPYVISYLETIGKRHGKEKWRWMVEAAFLARHKLNDMDEALRIAHELGNLYRPGMPIWTKNMEPILKSDMGDKKAAYLLTLEILKAEGDKMNPSEYLTTVNMICTRILSPQEAHVNPLCRDVK